MTTITSKFTKERLIDWAVVAVAERVRDLKDGPESVEAAANLKLAEIALASLTDEPVKRVNADQMHRVCLEANRHLDKYGAMAKEVNKLLGRTAPPAPVVPVEMNSDKAWGELKISAEDCQAWSEGWNACRAAMLHGDTFRENSISSTNNFREIAETSTNSPVIPGVYLADINTDHQH